MVEQILPVKKHRLVFIDVMRGIAVLWMIETHVVNVVLNNQLKQGFFYDFLSITNGFVAVSFLFCAGAGFWLAAMKKADDYKKFKMPLWIYLRRLGLILLLAYWLHFPTKSYVKFFSLTATDWLRFFECDVLQTIVYSSIIALIILMVTPKIKYLPYIYLFITLAVFIAAPFVWASNPMNSMPAFFGALFTHYPVSKFPLLPWSGYFFGGIALTSLFMSLENKHKFSIILMFSCISLMFILFYTIRFQPLYAYFDWWQGSLWHSIFRISCSVWVFSMLYLIEDYYRETRVGAALQLCGQESLYIYISHLLVCYGSIANYGMSYFMGSSVDWFSTFLVIFALCLACYATALGWHTLKDKDMKTARIVMASVTILFLIIFFVNPA